MPALLTKLAEMRRSFEALTHLELTRPDAVMLTGLVVLFALTARGLGSVPGAERGALVYLALIALVLGARRAAASGDRMAAVVTFLPVVVVPASYLNLNPAIDATTPTLYDAALTHLDTLVFGAPPALTLQRAAPPWAVDLLGASYLTYYAWPLILGLYLFRRRPEALDPYLTALLVCLMLNQVAYAFVPAVGPRFYLAKEFDAPLRGLFIGPYVLESLRHAPILRDCFPSGHTATTLFVLIVAWRLARPVAWVMTPVALSLIASTILCRFHYGVDLLAALVLAGLALAVLQISNSTQSGR